MGIFKMLINELLGTKKEYEVKDLGIFTCKVCNWYQDKHYTWSGIVQLPFYSKKTIILMEGDASAPLPQQVLELQTILQNWKSVITKLDSMCLTKAGWHIKKKYMLPGKTHFILMR